MLSYDLTHQLVMSTRDKLVGPGNLRFSSINLIFSSSTWTSTWEDSNDSKGNWDKLEDIVDDDDDDDDSDNNKLSGKQFK